MKAGDRVILTEDLLDLSKGLTGTVVFFNEPNTIDDNGSVITGGRVLAVMFDIDKYACVTRELNGKRIMVVTKCVLI